MSACTKYILSLLLYVFFNCVSIHGRHDRTTFNGLQAARYKRQSGYVYDRPSISFDLPTRNPIVSTSTQASPVNRISMQMYYAYPAPAERDTVNIGYNNAGTATGSTTGSVGGTGYNYNPPNPQLSSTGNIVSGNSDSNGYNYDVQNTAVQNTQQGNVVSTASSGNNLNGYTYGVQTAAVENTQSRPTGDIGGNNYDSSGYNYNQQNTGLQINSGQNTAIQNSLSGSDANIGTGGTATGSTGYSYGVQNNVVSNVGSEIATNTGNSGYTQTSTPVSTIGVSTSGVSTNAPKYLPPSNTVAVTTNTPINVQTGPTVAVTAPSNSYIPPSVAVQNTPAVTVTQTESNDIPAIRVVPQTSSTVNPGYLVPNTIPVTPSPPIKQVQTTVTPVRQPQQVPAQTYLPPVVTKGPISTPASSYLPPVF